MKKSYNTPLVEQTTYFTIGRLCDVSPGVNNIIDIGDTGGGVKPGGSSAPGRGKVF